MNHLKRLIVLVGLCTSLLGQDSGLVPNSQPQALPKVEESTTPKAPQKVEVKPTARDEEIATRLQGILEATGWFRSPRVSVREGVVFLEGSALSKETKTWAGQLASNTQDVSAVVNKFKVAQPSPWNFQPSLDALYQLWIELVHLLPTLLFGLLILGITWLISKGAKGLFLKIFESKVDSPLLQKVLAYAIATLIFLFGLYIVFKILGLTTVALTIIGGTGILGIILGIAFRDITENLLASILLSVHHPYRTGDLVKIGDKVGFIQSLNIRTTVMMNLSGNHVQIPNAVVYKSDLVNYTINPNRQEDFSFEVSYGVDVPSLQGNVMQVLEEHPAVLNDPEPWVLVNAIEGGCVQIRVYFWLDGSQHSWLKVRSSVIRLVKRKLQEEGVETVGRRETFDFQGPLDVKVTQDSQEVPPSEEPAPFEPVITDAEAGLSSEVSEIEEQVKGSRTPERGDKNLLKPTTGVLRNS